MVYIHMCLHTVSHAYVQYTLFLAVAIALARFSLFVFSLSLSLSFCLSSLALTRTPTHPPMHACGCMRVSKLVSKRLQHRAATLCTTETLRRPSASSSRRGPPERFSSVTQPARSLTVDGCCCRPAGLHCKAEASCAVPQCRVLS